MSGPWTRAAYEAATDDGTGEDRYELIEGELISKRGKKRPHVITVTLLRGWLANVFGGLFVAVNAPIDLAPDQNWNSEPEPDIIVTAGEAQEYLKNPGPADLRLVVEVADTTAMLDLTTKAGLYARAGIPEYWVADLDGRRIVVHRDPALDGYRSILAYGSEEYVAPSAALESALLVGSVFLG